MTRAELWDKKWNSFFKLIFKWKLIFLLSLNTSNTPFLKFYYSPQPLTFLAEVKKVLFSAHNLTLKHCTVQRFYFLLLRRNVIWMVLKNINNKKQRTLSCFMPFKNSLIGRRKAGWIFKSLYTRGRQLQFFCQLHYNTFSLNLYFIRLCNINTGILLNHFYICPISRVRILALIIF